jgi:uracil-DNA glycosylase
VIWTLSNLKTDILNYLESQKVYGKNIFFDDDGIEFKIVKEITGEKMAKKQSPNNEIKISQKISETKVEKTQVLQEIETKEQKVTQHIVKIDENSVSKNWRDAGSLEVLYDDIHDCMRCELGATRNKFVFGTGDPNADLLIIGEAPGRDEDLQGEPFVGRSGKLLTTILESIHLSRDDVFIANILKCRPPNNRRPSTSEVDTCEVYLHKQIELINPKYILALGLTAADTLLKEKCVMKDIRGEILDYRGKKLMITYHPSALLRNPNLKRPVWEDMKKLKSLLAN